MAGFSEKTIDSETIFKGKVLNVRRDKVKLINGSTSIREIIEHSGGVCILPFTSEGEILMVKQYRKAPEEVLLELPAGKLEEEESPLACARRELLEETGYKADNLEKVFSFYTSPGYSNELLHLYQGEVHYSGKIDTDEDEFLKMVKIKADDIMEFIKKGKIKDSKTIIGLLYFLRGDKVYE